MISKYKYLSFKGLPFRSYTQQCSKLLRTKIPTFGYSLTILNLSFWCLPLPFFRLTSPLEGLELPPSSRWLEIEPLGKLASPDISWIYTVLVAMCTEYIPPSYSRGNRYACALLENSCEYRRFCSMHYRGSYA